MPPAKNTATGKCAVPNCTSSKKNVTAHRFPKDPVKAEVWKAAIRNPDIANIDNITLNKSYCVCTLHFLSDHYVPQTTKPMLRKEAVPTLLLPAMKDDPDIVYVKQENDDEEDKDKISSVTPTVTPVKVYIRGVPPTDLEHSKALMANGSHIASLKRKRSAILRFVSKQLNFNPTVKYLYRRA